MPINEIHENFFTNVCVIIPLGVRFLKAGFQSSNQAREQKKK